MNCDAKLTEVQDRLLPLRSVGVAFNTYPHFNHDALGIWTASRGKISVAWFKDPDGNVLSITNA